MTYIRRSVIKVEGGERKSRTSDDNVQELLRDMIKELKISNFHMSILSDTHITDDDINGGIE